VFFIFEREKLFQKRGSLEWQWSPGCFCLESHWKFFLKKRNRKRISLRRHGYVPQQKKNMERGDESDDEREEMLLCLFVDQKTKAPSPLRVRVTHPPPIFFPLLSQHILPAKMEF
jgi:hypothetical protein